MPFSDTNKKIPFPHNKFINLSKMVIFWPFNLNLLQNLTCLTISAAGFVFSIKKSTRFTPFHFCYWQNLSYCWKILGETDFIDLVICIDWSMDHGLNPFSHRSHYSGHLFYFPFLSLNFWNHHTVITSDQHLLVWFQNLRR